MSEMQQVDLNENDEENGPAAASATTLLSIIPVVQEPLVEEAQEQADHDCRDNSNSYLLFQSFHSTREEESRNSDSMLASSSIIMTNNTNTIDATSKPTINCIDGTTATSTNGTTASSDINNSNSDTRRIETAIQSPSQSQSQLHHRKKQTNRVQVQIPTNTNLHGHHPSSVSTNPNAQPQPQPLIIFGIDLSHRTLNVQFFTCASGVFLFTIIYGYLQELISVHITGRQYTLFLSTCQFAGYAFWSILLTTLHPKEKPIHATEQQSLQEKEKEAVESWRLIVLVPTGSMSPQNYFSSRLSDTDTDSESLSLQSIQEEEEYYTPPSSPTTTTTTPTPTSTPTTAKPWKLYIILSLLRAIDVGMTNGAMRFLNYPMKTLIKSSRAAFTMMGGMLIGRKRYPKEDYWMVGMLVLGLGFFIHADLFSNDAVFHPIGLAMLTVSLVCDGAVANYSELVMIQYKISQDEFQSSIYSISFIAMLCATIASGELKEAFSAFFLQHGTIADIQNASSLSSSSFTWTIEKKIAVLIVFTMMGLCGSSCAGAITKKFGALSMSITSTTRKAFTLFISFVAFKGNKCTGEHLVGMVVFMGALFMKSLNGVNFGGKGVGAWRNLYGNKYDKLRGKEEEDQALAMEDGGVSMVDVGKG